MPDGSGATARCAPGTRPEFFRLPLVARPGWEPVTTARVADLWRLHHDPKNATVLHTGHAELTLRPMVPDDAANYVTLVQRNREHLTRHGDYADAVQADVAAVRAEFARIEDRPLRFGMVLEGALVGRVDLVAVEPPRYGLGYWVSEEASGRGLATSAVAAVLTYAADALQATDVFAGVTHGNARSIALLTRLGFQPVERFETYTRFHRPLRQAP